MANLQTQAISLRHVDWLGVRILLIDDDVELCSLLAELLKREGFEVQMEHDGAKGLERARSGQFELIVLDVMLPGLDGFGVLRALRRHILSPRDGPGISGRNNRKK